MRRLINWLRKLRVSEPVQPSLSPSRESRTGLPEADAAWSDDHARAWEQFLSSEVGISFMARFKAVADGVSKEACADQFHTSHSAGTANGWHQARQWAASLANTSDSISRTSRAHDEAMAQPQYEPTDSQAAGRAELVERYAP
jgi:hypothetical protein